MFFAVWCSALWVGVTTFGSLLSGIAHLARRLPRHAASIIDLLMRSHSLRVRPLYLGAAAALVLLLAVYWPAGRLIRHLVDPRQLLQTAAPFASGDVVLFRPHRAEDPLPEPGEVMVYQNVPFRTTSQATPGYPAVPLQIRGEFVDRVVAGPNSKVRWDGNVVFVDGATTDCLAVAANAGSAKGF